MKDIILFVKVFYKLEPKLRKLKLTPENRETTSIIMPYHVLNNDPLIIIMVWWEDVHKIIFEKFKGNKVYFIFLLWWTAEYQFVVRRIRYLLREYKKRYPKHHFTFLCNSEQEYELFQKFQLPCIFCNKNSLVDETIFTVKPNEEKKYNAIYNAKMEWFKRHYLASKIDKLALIAHFDEINASSYIYYCIIRMNLSKAIWLNRLSFLGNFRKIDPVRVSKYTNKARVGLCLSKKEGTMYASIEYLLCGLPVVSTRSVGGRDVFFNEDYVKTVNSNKRAVEEGVIEMIERSINPEYIRRKTLEKMKPHRERFTALVQEIYDKEGITRKFRDEWKNVFFNKMVMWQDIKLIDDYIEN